MLGGAGRNRARNAAMPWIEQGDKNCLYVQLGKYDFGNVAKRRLSESDLISIEQAKHEKGLIQRFINRCHNSVDTCAKAHSVCVDKELEARADAKRRHVADLDRSLSEHARSVQSFASEDRNLALLSAASFDESELPY